MGITPERGRSRDFTIFDLWSVASTASCRNPDCGSRAQHPAPVQWTSEARVSARIRFSYWCLLLLSLGLGRKHGRISSCPSFPVQKNHCRGLRSGNKSLQSSKSLIIKIPKTERARKSGWHVGSPENDSEKVISLSLFGWCQRRMTDFWAQPEGLIFSYKARKSMLEMEILFKSLPTVAWSQTYFPRQMRMKQTRSQGMNGLFVVSLISLECICCLNWTFAIRPPSLKGGGMRRGKKRACLVLPSLCSRTRFPSRRYQVQPLQLHLHSPMEGRWRASP